LASFISIGTSRQAFSGDANFAVQSISFDSLAREVFKGPVAYGISSLASSGTAEEVLKGSIAISFYPIFPRAGLPGPDFWGDSSIALADPQATVIARERFMGSSLADFGAHFHVAATGYPLPDLGLGSIVRASRRLEEDPTAHLSYGNLILASDTFTTVLELSFSDLSGTRGQTMTIPWVTVPDQIKILHFDLQLITPFRGEGLRNLTLRVLGEPLGTYDVMASEFDPSTSLVRVRSHKGPTDVSLSFSPSSRAALSDLTAGKVRVTLHYNFP
jgi:hypothetical protein